MSDVTVMSGEAVVRHATVMSVVMSHVTVMCDVTVESDGAVM